MTQAEFPAEQSKRGEFVRQQSAFRRCDVAPEPGRYHLYVSLACPWAHRTVVARRLKGLDGAVGLTVVDPIRDERGWRFDEADPINGFEFLSQAYQATDAAFSARVTVPVLWDRTEGVIVNNESADILRLFDGPLDSLATHDLPLYPEALRDEIDAVNQDVYDNVNNGVYRAGFATSQEAYEAAVGLLFDQLDALDARLADARWLVGNVFTEADLRLFTTLVRFDAVYVGHFKCNVRRLADYDHLAGYLRDLYQTAGIGETVDFDHIKRHYYVTHRKINPTGVVPIGPELGLDEPHGRDALGPPIAPASRS